MNDLFLKRHEVQFENEHHMKASSSTHFPSRNHNYPRQGYGYNCGVYVLWYNLMWVSKRKYIARVVLNPSLIRCQVMIYLFGLNLYFNNAGNAVEDKEKDVFKNMLEMILRSKNDVL